MHALEGVDPALIMRSGRAMKPAMDWRTEKENAGRFTWTLGLYGTAAMAAEAALTEEEYWQQITDACFLDEDDPIARWRQVSEQIGEYVARLNALPIEALHVVGTDVDLHVTLGERRQWVGGSGRNIPSFEIFTSPDWRGTEGWIAFNQAALSLRQPRQGRPPRVRRRTRCEGNGGSTTNRSSPRWSRARTRTRWGSSR